MCSGTFSKHIEWVNSYWNSLHTTTVVLLINFFFDYASFTGKFNAWQIAHLRYYKFRGEWHIFLLIYYGLVDRAFVFSLTAHKWYEIVNFFIIITFTIPFGWSSERLGSMCCCIRRKPGFYDEKRTTNRLQFGVQ